MKFYILFCMIFMHIVDDYYLQGILASMKQRSWWERNAPESMYKNDYKMALAAHGFSWAFMTMIPIVIWLKAPTNPMLMVMFIFNMICHIFIDNEKANKKTINLIIDQMLHLLQLLITWWLFV